MKIKVFLLMTLVLNFPIILTSCQSNSISYEDPNKIDLLDDRWNDADARLTVETMVDSLVHANWLTEFNTENKGQKPKLLVGKFENRSDEHVDMDRMYESSRSYLIKSGKIRFVEGKERDALLGEMQFQGSGTTKKNEAKRVGNMKAADFFLFSSLSKITNRGGGKERINYQITMRLTNIESSEIVWEEIKAISKKVTKSSVGL